MDDERWEQIWARHQASVDRIFEEHRQQVNEIIDHQCRAAYHRLRLFLWIVGLTSGLAVWAVLTFLR